MYIKISCPECTATLDATITPHYAPGFGATAFLKLTCMVPWCSNFYYFTMVNHNSAWRITNGELENLVIYGVTPQGQLVVKGSGV